MAEYRGAARNQQHPEQPANVVFADPDLDLQRRRNQQLLCLDAGRVLLLCGALVTVIPTAFDLGPAANTTTLAFVGFVFWILGAWLCLMALTPAAPWAVRAGAAVASTVLNCLSPPVHYYN